MKAADLIAVDLADSEGKQVQNAAREAYTRGNDLSLPEKERAAAFAKAVAFDIQLVDWLVRRKGPFKAVYSVLDRASTLSPNSPTLKNLRDVAEVIDGLIQKPPKDTEPPGPATIMVWEGMTVEVGANIGNTLCYYIAAAAVNFVSARDFAPSSFHRPLHNNPFVGEDYDEDFEDDEDEWEDNERELAPLPLVIQNLPPVVKLVDYPEVADLLQFIGGGPMSVSPPSTMDWAEDRGILRAMQPVLSDVVEIALEASAAARPASYSPSGSDVVVHFRCSDVPFSRHPSYRLLTYAWWRQALRIGTVELFSAHKRDLSLLDPSEGQFAGLSVEIISCASWNIENDDVDGAAQREACGAYSASLARFLETLPAVRSPVQLRCGSADEDFEAMVKAPLLIGSGSSMSTVAAHAARWPRVAVMPDTVDRSNSSVFPSKARLPLRKGFTILPSAGYRVAHESVDDYEDTSEVLDLLVEEDDVAVTATGDFIGNDATAADI
jgi:hypothetical protein